MRSLHFHEDPAGLFADIKLDDGGFTRFPVNSPDQQDKLVAAAARIIEGYEGPQPG